MVKLKRVYLKASRTDGFRILVDRLWPRGVSKKNAQLDAWVKEVSPSTRLRKWFGHNPSRWPEFISRYRKELKANKDAVAQLKALLRKHKNSTLLFGAKDEAENNAVALKKILKI